MKSKVQLDHHLKTKVHGFSINIKLLIKKILVSACHPHRKGFPKMWTYI